MFGRKKKPYAPWEKYYTKEELNVKVPEISIYQLIEESAKKNANYVALEYMGKNITYRQFLQLIDRCARAFLQMGFGEGDIITICMPNTPEALISFYAINKIGAIANMIHPLSSEEEIKNYLQETSTTAFIMIDVCYEKVRNVINDTSVKKTIVVSAKNSMPMLLGIGYMVTKGYKVKKPKRNDRYIYWNEFMLKGYLYRTPVVVKSNPRTPSVILHSGGTSGNPKGILLSDYNFNALAEQVRTVFKGLMPGDSILDILPNFHGFGLGVSMHFPLSAGLKLVLIPQFNAKKLDELIVRYHPAVLTGVPTLYEAMMSNSGMKHVDLSCLKYIVSGGDSLSIAMFDRLNKFLKEHGANVRVLQGYGMTESLAATAASHDGCYREGSIGIPFPGNYFKMVYPGTQDEVAIGEDGEICVSGPTVMIGYLNNEKETNEVLQRHKDKNIWLHTGDIGCMDENGILYFKQRLKRMIISSGYNVYPQHIESIIEQHEAVLNCTVVGIPHPYKVEVAKAYIVLKDEYKAKWSVRKSIEEHCKKNLAKYSIPYEYEYREALPKTLLGKVNYRELEKENGKD